MSEKNDSIKCSVDTCRHNMPGEKCCTLDSISVGCSTSKATSCECTECDSFSMNS
ncbi:MAG: DUF1540 domain-containing protein [Oscillospiraceae bacterium]|jgi:hypothetical protein|nr:DUF1540 domain-containing protein [Oscillospiraceae bacterium]